MNTRYPGLVTILVAVFALNGCGLDSPGERIGWLLLLPLGVIILLLWYVRRWPRHQFYDRDERRNPDHDEE